MLDTLDTIVNKIIAINHAWKLSREEFGQDFVATKSLRDTKSSLQATLLREYPQDVYLIWATDNDDHGEGMYSVRLRQPFVIEGVLREDVEHLPARIANEIFTKQEINHFLNNNK